MLKAVSVAALKESSHDKNFRRKKPQVNNVQHRCTLRVETCRYTCHTERPDDGALSKIFMLDYYTIGALIQGRRIVY